MHSPETDDAAARGRQWRSEPEGIRDALEAGHHVVVLGPAGIGKTHLVNAALRLGPPPGTHVVDLTPVVDHRAAARGGPLDHLVAPHTVREDPDTVAELLWDWACGRAESVRLLLRLDNAHLLDADTLAVIERVARRPGATLITTHRADPSTGPLFRELGDVTRFTVRPLSTGGVETLLVELLGGFPTADTVHRLWASSRGNPFYLCELVRDQQERGALVSEDGIWVWTGTPALSLRMLDTTVHDLDGLRPEERDAVELAAVVGSIPDVAITSELTERLLRLGLLRPALAAGAAGRLEIVHPIQASAISSLVGTGRRRELLARARAWDPGDLRRRDEPIPVALQIDPQVTLSVPDLLRACGHALRADAPHAALELTSAALLTATAELDSVALLTSRADAHLHIGDAEAALTDLASARATLEHTHPYTETIIDAYVGTLRLESMVRHFLSNDPDATLALLDGSIELLLDNPGHHITRAVNALMALRLAHLAWNGRHAEMLPAALDMLAEPPQPQDLVPLVGPALFGLALAGRAEAAATLTSRYLSVVQAHPALHRWEPAVFTLIQFVTLLSTGELRAAARTLPLAGGMVDLVSRHQRQGVLAAAYGDWSTARHELRAANARLRLRDSMGMLPYTLAVEAKVAAADGDATSARALLEELRDTTRRCSLVTGAFLDLHALDALVWLQDAGATAVATRMARDAACDGQHAVEIEALHRLAVTAGTRGVRDALRSRDPAGRVSWLAERVEGKRSAALLAHLRALLTPGDRGIAAAAERLREVGVHLPAPTSRARLTRREREIATLAAGGMTSKAIAQRLVLSVRTVDSHLAGTYAKLGVHSRDGLPHALAAAPG